MALDRIIHLMGLNRSTRHVVTVQRDGTSGVLDVPAHPTPFRWGAVLWPPDPSEPNRAALAPGEVSWRLYTLTDDASLDRYVADRYGSGEGRPPGMHRTPTIDLVIVLEGRLELVLDEGTVELGPGDTVVQQGAAHAWRVLDPPVRMSVVMIGS